MAVTTLLMPKKPDAKKTDTGRKAEREGVREREIERERAREQESKRERERVSISCIVHLKD